MTSDWFQDCQRNAGFTTWAVTWRSGFLFSGAVDFEQLAELPDFSFESVLMREQQDQALFDADGEMVHGMMGNRVQKWK